MNSLHPSTEQLIEYSAGSLSTSLALCVSAHIACCSHCKNQLDKLNTAGAVIFSELPRAEVDNGLLDSIFSKIDESEKTRAAQVKVQLKREDTLPSSIHRLTGYDPASLNWRDHGRNVKSATLFEKDGFKSSLIRIAAGAKIPSHTHRGTEYTVVLEGSFSDADGVYKQGDFIRRDANHSHSPMATTDTDCICLVALDAPLRFSNPVMEIYNRFSPL